MAVMTVLVVVLMTTMTVMAAMIDTVAGIIIAVTTVAVTVLMATFCSVTVVIDDRGLTVASTPTHLGLAHRDLDEITSVEVTTVNPMAWGGWGLRAGMRGRAVVVRRGEGIVVGGGRHRLTVTVDDVDSAATALANWMAHRPSVP